MSTREQRLAAVMGKLAPSWVYPNIGTVKASVVAKQTRALLYEDLTYPNGTKGIVYNDPTYSGIYFKSGGVGVGSWEFSTSLDASDFFFDWEQDETPTLAGIAVPQLRAGQTWKVTGDQLADMVNAKLGEADLATAGVSTVFGFDNDGQQVLRPSSPLFDGKSSYFADVDAVVSFHDERYSGFWTDGVSFDDEFEDPDIVRHEGRMMIGFASEVTGRRAGAQQTSWFQTAPDGPGWAPRDSDLCVMSRLGSFAITGMSRSSDKVGISGTPSTSGLGGFAIINSTSAFGRAAYFETQLDASAVSGAGAGIEIVVKNKRFNHTTTPYGVFGTVIGQYIVAGGDPTYGGIPVAPANAAVLIARGGEAGRGKAITAISRSGNIVTSAFSDGLYLAVGSSVTVVGVTDSAFDGTFTLLSLGPDYKSATWAQTAGNASSSGGTISFATDNNFRWNSGIVFDRYGLVGSDGSGSSGQRTGVAMRMAAGHNIRWDAPAGQGAYLRSDVNLAGFEVGMVFQNGNINFLGGNGVQILQLQQQDNAVNYIRIDNAVVGADPQIRSTGSDSNIDISFLPKGTGRMQWGSHAAIAAETITGFIEMKTSDGIVRKLAIVS